MVTLTSRAASLWNAGSRLVCSPNLSNDKTAMHLSLLLLALDHQLMPLGGSSSLSAHSRVCCVMMAQSQSNCWGMAPCGRIAQKHHKQYRFLPSPMSLSPMVCVGCRIPFPLVPLRPALLFPGVVDLGCFYHTFPTSLIASPVSLRGSPVVSDFLAYCWEEVDGCSSRVSRCHSVLLGFSGLLLELFVNEELIVNWVVL